MLKDSNGVVWYSEEYLKTMMDREHWRGFVEGLKVDFHTVTPNLQYRTIEDVKKELKEFILNMP